MPTYEYQCAKCGASFDIFQSMKDATLTVCPKDRCAQSRWGRGKVKRTLGTGAGLIFKGSGFYITDYRSEGYKQAAKSDSAPSAGSTGGGDAAKPATKAESKPAAKEKSKAAPAKSAG
jgi:putative FmdB family regulatory protein